MKGGIKMTHKQKKDHKSLLLMNALMDRIEDLTSKTDSPYSRARDLVVEARYALDDKPQKSLKYVRKAYRIVCSEGRTAYKYNEVQDYLSKHPTDSKKLDKLTKEYKSCINAGKYRKALKYVSKMKKMTDIGFTKNHASIDQVSPWIGEDGGVTVVINSTTDHQLTLESVNISSRDTSASLSESSARALQPFGQQTYSLNVGKVDKATVSVNASYKVGLQSFNQKETFCFTRKGSV